MSVARRNYGKNHGYKIDGVKAPGVTTIIGANTNKGGLPKWYARTAADLAVNEWERLSELPRMDRHAAIMSAAEGERDAAARRGTEVHRYASRVVAGEPLLRMGVPDELLGHVRAYANWTKRFDVEPIAVELVIANREHAYCGTLDLIAHLLGQIWLLELKTSRSGIYPESALQACAYEHAEVYTFPGEADDEKPFKGLGVERCGSVHIRDDGCDLRALDTGEVVWQWFRHLAWMYQHGDETPPYESHGPNKEWVGELIDPPERAGS